MRMMVMVDKDWNDENDEDGDEDDSRVVIQ